MTTQRLLHKVKEPAGIYRTLPTPALVQRIAHKYDESQNYGEEYVELVFRVGREEAERLVDQA
jgi:hypothetical protein